MDPLGYKICYLRVPRKWAREGVEKDLKDRMSLRVLEEFTAKLRTAREILPTKFPSTAFLSCLVKQNSV